MAGRHRSTEAFLLAGANTGRGGGQGRGVGVPGLTSFDSWGVGPLDEEAMLHGMHGIATWRCLQCLLLNMHQLALGRSVASTERAA